MQSDSTTHIYFLQSYRILANIVLLSLYTREFTVDTEQQFTLFLAQLEQFSHYRIYFLRGEVAVQFSSTRFNYTEVHFCSHRQ